MSDITKPLLLNETGEAIAQQLAQQTSILTALASGVNYKSTTIKELLTVIRAGKAEDTYQIGDQIVVPWTDIVTGTEYTCPMDVVAFPTATLQDGEEVPAMRLQWHYATPFGVQFNNYQAFFYCDEKLLAGTYYIEIGTTWGSNGYCVADKNYQFTLTQDVPAGGQLAGFRGAPDQAPSTWKVYSYESNTAKEPIETVAVTEGDSGTKLGVLKTGGDGTLNCLQRTAYGYNRWGQSALRQWLNSDAGVNAWWTPQNKFDRQPDQLSQKAGFLTGFDADFREALTAVKVVTALNTITDAVGSNAETLEITYDKMFPLALEQMSINPQLAGEGETCPYWKKASQLTTKMQQYQTYAQIRAFAIENHTSPQHVRLRSANRGGSYNTWNVNSSGYVTNYIAVNALRSTPACDLC